MEVFFKLTTIIECSKVINESKNATKARSPFNVAFLNFVNLFVLLIVQSKFVKNGAGLKA